MHEVEAITMPMFHWNSFETPEVPMDLNWRWLDERVDAAEMC
jgi:hypothetical protein